MEYFTITNAHGVTAHVCVSGEGFGIKVMYAKITNKNDRRQYGDAFASIESVKVGGILTKESKPITRNQFLNHKRKAEQILLKLTVPNPAPAVVKPKKK